MVVLSILGIFEEIVNGLLGGLPQPSPPGLAAKATQVVSDGWFGHLGWANNYVPLSETLTAAGGLLAIWAVLYVVKLTLWLLRGLHVLGSD